MMKVDEYGSGSGLRNVDVDEVVGPSVDNVPSSWFDGVEGFILKP